jgi:endo-1,4-beta-D-glucanase Y
MKREFLYLFVISAISLCFGAHYPFPQNKVTYGIKVVGDSSADVQYVYNSWLSGYYQEQDTLARITWDNDSQTASEGIGYGMLIMVCMDNAQNNTRPKFDKLWRYYKKFRDYNGVMNWKIDKFSSVAYDGQGGATDADLDAAAALILAYRQWGDTTYFSDARDLASAIWQVEVNSDRFLKPGDSWDGQQDPSYFNTGAMELFKSVDANDWSTVINNCYDLLYKVCDTATGFPPDWCDQDGTIPSGEGFGWEAIRVPWRMAWAYSWFGREDAAKIDNKIAIWIRRATGDNPSAIKSLYMLDGTPQGDGNAAYAGGLSCAGMTSA